MTRTFLAADVDEAILDGAAALASALEGRVDGKPRWVARGLMHATVRFFGDVDDARLAKLIAIVPRLAEGASPPTLRISRIDAFPEPSRARILVLPIDDGGFLAGAHAEIEAHAVALDFAKEDRAYRPHLTLARLKMPRNLSRLLAGTPVDLAGSVDALTLYASSLGPDGPKYETLARRAFRRRGA